MDVQKPIPLIVRTTPNGSVAPFRRFELMRGIAKYLNANDPYGANTPSCVIAEIVDIHSISIGGTLKNIDSLVDIVNSDPEISSNVIEIASSEDFRKKVKEINHPLNSNARPAKYSVKELEAVALFINPNETRWTDSEIFSAFKHLAAFEDFVENSSAFKDKDGGCAEDFENLLIKLDFDTGDEPLYGRKTSSNINSIDLLMAYTGIVVSGNRGILNKRSTQKDVYTAFSILAGDLLTRREYLSERPSDIAGQISSIIGALLMPQCYDVNTRSKLVKFLFEMSERTHSFCDEREEKRFLKFVPNSEDYLEPLFTAADIKLEHDYLSGIPSGELIKLIPSSEAQAAVLAFLLFSIDVSTSISPSSELAELKMSRLLFSASMRTPITYSSMSGKILENHNTYTPRDPKFAKRFMAAPIQYDCLSTWSSVMSQCYTSSQISKILKMAGFSYINLGFRGASNSMKWTCNEAPAAAACGDETSSNEALTAGDIHFECERKAIDFLFSVPSFIIGYTHDCINTVSHISLNEFLEYEWANIISFGTPGNYTAFSIEDVAMHFSNSSKFELPKVNAESSSDNYILTVRNVLQLKLLTKRVLTSGKNSIRFIDKNFDKKHWDLLDSVIKDVETKSLTLSSHGSLIKNTIENSSEDVSRKIKESIMALTELAWYMRGWKVSEESAKDNSLLPIASINTCFELDKEPEFTLNVTEAILKFETITNSFEEGRIILDAPLVLLSTACVNRVDDERITREIPPQFVPVINTEPNNNKEVTIKSQLSLIKTGDTMSSCVRTSSNYFIASAFFYMIAAGIDPGFDIRKVDQIF